MDLKEFENFIKKNNLTIRAIPEKVVEHWVHNGETTEKVKYPKHGGELLVVQVSHSDNTVMFNKGAYYKSLNEIVDAYSK